MMITRLLIVLYLSLISYAQTRHIVVLRDELTKQDVDELVSTIREADRDPSLPDVQCEVHDVLDTLSKMLIVTASKGAVDKIKEMEEVSYVEEDQVIEGASSTYLSWALDRLDQTSLPLDQHYQPTGTGDGVDVYVMDSGIKYDHDEFEGRASFGGFDMVPFETEPGNGTDCHGHGTHVASLVGGVTYGVAKRVTLYSIRVLNCYNQGYSSHLLSALEFVARRISQNGRPSVINLSLASVQFNAVDNMMETLYNEGIPVVVAAGNGNVDACTYSPASSRHVLTVAGTTIDDTPWLRKPATNLGKCVDIFAPADYVLGASHQCNNCCRTRSGTSMASGLVTGVLALYLEREPLLTALQLYKKVLDDSLDGAVNLAVDGVSHNFINEPTKLVTVEGGCGGRRIYEVRGSILSPAYPENYPNSLNCTWQILAQAKEDVKIVIKEFDLAENDYLTIIDGNHTLAHLTGMRSLTLKRKFRSRTNTMIVVFVSDNSLAGKGFWLKYTRHVAGENALAQPIKIPFIPPQVPAIRTNPLTENYDTVLFLRVASDNVQYTVEQWANQSYYLKFIQSFSYFSPTGRLKTRYNLVLSNLSLDESQYIMEMNGTELLRYYNTIKRRYVITCITQRLRRRQVVYSVIFTKQNKRMTKHLVYWNDTLAEYETRIIRLQRRGYKLKAQSFTVLKNDDYSISSIYAEEKESWCSLYNLTSHELFDRIIQNSATSVLTSFTSYMDSNRETKFAAVFEELGHPQQLKYTVWGRYISGVRDVMKTLTSSDNQFEAVSVTGYEYFDELRYSITFGDRQFYYQ